MLFKKEKKMNVPDLWNFMTSLNKKDKALFEELLDNDNEPLEYKGDVKQGGLLKNKKMIERRVIEKEESLKKKRMEDCVIIRNIVFSQMYMKC